MSSSGDGGDSGSRGTALSRGRDRCNIVFIADLPSCGCRRRSSETVRCADREGGDVRQPYLHVDAARTAPQFDAVIVRTMLEHVARGFDGVLLARTFDQLVRADRTRRVEEIAPVLGQIRHASLPRSTEPNERPWRRDMKA